ncbi:hypothetical protein LEP1GSC058_3116 [Leptospira fainei serovar Hurstbridge str. BUT 6]|uniref:Uncharacterized protein n=1 Tax=Leptospira fainei serovar Hurstbridge str. BUT 6 TaxID=1193011 RepID=S3UYD0_9LEPT|nr:hypothetical protein LEP1GSC058_3116 [Leptospira fainei serovar Hurstbridge str. BUT 6]
MLEKRWDSMSIKAGFQDVLWRLIPDCVWSGGIPLPTHLFK